MYRAATTLANGVEYVAERLVMLVFGVMVTAICISVVTRNTGISIPWLEELARFMQIWTIGLGFALALRKGLLSGTEIILFLLPTRVARAAVIAVKIAMLIMSGLMLKVSLPLIEQLFKTNQLSSSLQFPVVYIYLGLYTGFAMSALFILTSLVSNVYGQDDSLDRTFAQIEDVSKLGNAEAHNKKKTHQ